MPPYNEQIAQLEPADRRGATAAEHEGRLRRLADGRADAGHAACTACRCCRRRSTRSSRTVALALLHELGGENDQPLINVAIGAGVNLHGTPELAAAEAAREAGNAPNTVLAAAASHRRARGAPRRRAQSRAC